MVVGMFELTADALNWKHIRKFERRISYFWFLWTQHSVGYGNKFDTSTHVIRAIQLIGDRGVGVVTRSERSGEVKTVCGMRVAVG